MTLECYMRVLAGREKLEGHSRVEVSRPSEIWRWLTESDTSTQSSENGINEHWNSMGDPSHIRYVKRIFTPRKARRPHVPSYA